MDQSLKATSVKEGQIYDSFYGNGEPCGSIIITRVSDKSIFHKRLPVNNGDREFRDSRNTFSRQMDEKIRVIRK